MYLNKSINNQKNVHCFKSANILKGKISAGVNTLIRYGSDVYYTVKNREEV